MNDLEFEVIDDNGKILKLEMLYSFSEGNINYLIYTDKTYDANNELNIYASRYDIVDNKYVLTEIVDEKEYDLVDKKIMEFVGAEL